MKPARFFSAAGAFVLGLTLLSTAPAHSAAAHDTHPVHAHSARPSDPVARIASSTPSRRELAEASPRERLELLARCTDIGGEDYCLHVGFVDDPDSPKLWRHLARQITEPVASRTGDLGLEERLDDVAEMPAAQRTRVERRQIVRAIEAEAAGRSTASRTTRSGWVGRQLAIGRHNARRQVKYYYCGPATLQMIDGADDHQFDHQSTWAIDLRTEQQRATWIGDITRQINRKTGWDTVGGTYSVVNVVGWSRERYWRSITRQLNTGAPVVEHPKLSKRYHRYLSTSGAYGGHFQVGRGFSRSANGQRYVHILEPYNEPDWTGYSRRTWGAQKVPVYQALRANQANQGNIGL